MAFRPAVLTVARGDTVVWINHDIVPHTATAPVPASIRAAAAWDTGQLMQGQNASYVPRYAGEASYICTLHPTMRGKLIIQ